MTFHHPGLTVLYGGELLLTSPLTHVGGLVLGAIGVRILGFPKQMWWKAVLGPAGLHILCRWVTPEQKNVNLAFAIWAGCESLFPSHLAYLSTVTALCLVVFAGVEFAMRKTGFARPSSRA